jgi:hypothetical protein
MRAVVFRYTEAEVLEASRLLYRMMPIMRFFRWVIAALILYEVVTLAMAVGEGAMDVVGEQAGWLVVGLAVAGFMVVVDCIIIPRKLRRSLAEYPAVMGDSMLTWDEQGFSLRTGLGETQRRWSDLSRWRESRGCLLLYESEVVCQNLPKRALTAEQAAEIRALLTAGVGASGSKRRGG